MAVVALLVGWKLLDGVALEAKDAPSSQDPVAKLWRQVAAGEVRLDNSTEPSFLKSVLAELQVPIASQVLVFSKTSLQRDLIQPLRPRAIYYNGECYVGWVQGGALELVGVDPVEGPRYYLLHRGKGGAAKGADFAIGADCTSCHVGAGLQVQSVQVDRKGRPVPGSVSFATTDESPLEERWGGWYVTGRSAGESHQGNRMEGAGVAGVAGQGKEWLSLKGVLPIEAYPIETSDIVALMVLEHQYAMQNTLTETGRAARSLRARMSANPADPHGRHMSVETGERLLRKHAETVVRKLLFTGEHELTGGGVSGDLRFQEAFLVAASKAGDGTSLRDFELSSRLFKYRCSYMIYSASFTSLPGPFKAVILRVLKEALEGQAATATMAGHLTDAERKQVLKILRETKMLPD